VGRGIVTQAWSPLGGVYVYGGKPKNALDDPVITAIADGHGKTAAQVMLRWHLDSRRSAIPKSVRPARIAENLDVFDFALPQDEVAAIDALDTGVRGGPNQDELDFRTFDRPIPE
jgi:2,5-diketo-D-gluconate reductase A